MAFSKTLSTLRQARGLSQEQMAQAVGVSRQAVQKWENGASTPGLDHLLRLRGLFGVSMDSLLADGPDTQELRPGKVITQDYEFIHRWESYAANLETEYVQLYEEGRDVEPLKNVFLAVGAMKPGPYRDRMADVLFDLSQSLAQRADYPFIEPSELEGILALRPEQPSDIAEPKDKTALRDRVYGAWLGRICGCLLGKTVEGIRTKELDHLLGATGNYPLSRYIRAADLTDELCASITYPLRKRVFADRISTAPTDDDTNYTVLAAAKLIERYGRDFTPRDVAQVWIDSQPKREYCTAERVAYKNIVNGYTPPDSARYKNPFREWIGAQIRADYFGYICPGNPQAAAEMAWRDASVSHVKNGIYGEMFVAAMLACAFVFSGVRQIILGGLSQISATSRLYKQVTEILHAYESGVSQADCFAHIHQTYDEHKGHDWCHTISNAAIVVASLLYGEGDYGKSICMAVQAGFDTDCNGATVGSILGALHGSQCVGPSWRAPVNGKLETSIFGVGTVRIEDLVDMTMRHMA